MEDGSVLESPTEECSFPSLPKKMPFVESVYEMLEGHMSVNHSRSLCPVDRSIRQSFEFRRTPLENNIVLVKAASIQVRTRRASLLKIEESSIRSISKQKKKRVARWRDLGILQMAKLQLIKEESFQQQRESELKIKSLSVGASAKKTENYSFSQDKLSQLKKKKLTVLASENTKFKNKLVELPKKLVPLRLYVSNQVRSKLIRDLLCQDKEKIKQNIKYIKNIVDDYEWIGKLKQEKLLPENYGQEKGRKYDNFKSKSFHKLRS